MDESKLINICWNLIEVYEKYLLDKATAKQLAEGFLMLLDVLPEDMDKSMDNY
tara:strand:+ start:1634 stop:1792 length:159 start_codon:yes stop_codon:yes gene_type:complete